MSKDFELLPLPFAPVDDGTKQWFAEDMRAYALANIAAALNQQAGVVEAYAEACRVLESYPADYPHNSAGVALRDLCAALAAVKPAALVKEKDRA